MEILYTAEALATGDGRNGHVATMDGLLDADVRVPKAMGGAGRSPPKASPRDPTTRPAPWAA